MQQQSISDADPIAVSGFDNGSTKIMNKTAEINVDVGMHQLTICAYVSRDISHNRIIVGLDQMYLCFKPGGRVLETIGGNYCLESRRFISSIKTTPWFEKEDPDEIDTTPVDVVIRRKGSKKLPIFAIPSGIRLFWFVVTLHRYHLSIFMDICDDSLVT